jgi:3-oxoacyl-[acyl-carrier protein] reductase
MEKDTLTGKVELVTGGSRGIGAAISARLAALGARVAINYRSGTGAAQEEIRRHGGIAETPRQANRTCVLRRCAVDSEP